MPRHRVVRTEIQRRFPFAVREGFDYITDPGNWSAYWPRFVRLDPGSQWREPGDRARLTLRMLGRDVELEMTLARIEPCHVVEYTSEQRGLPPAWHRRAFDAAGDGGFTYRIVVEYSPRTGWQNLFDRTLVRHAITRTARETMANLDRHFREAGAMTAARPADRRAAEGRRHANSSPSNPDEASMPLADIRTNAKR
jgi:Polyketide cyclase / dehydrase and lipid transport